MNFLVDTSAEIFIGQTVDLKEQQNALGISQEYIESAASLEDYATMNPANYFTFVSHNARRYSTKRFWNAQIF